AKNGQALLPIVISAKASDATKAVAKEFADYLGRIAGATFKVEIGDGTSGIVLGSMADFPTPALDAALKIYPNYDGVEAFAIRTREKKVLLLGATDIGASHAAFRFLEGLGCRWFFPHKAWEVVPSTPDLKWDRNITDRPQMMVRTIWFEAGSGTPQAETDYANWKRHNLVAESFHVNIAGGGMAAPFTKEILAAHPEYEPLLKQADGTMKRVWDGSWQPELANPGARKVIVDYAIKFFKDNPTAEMVNLDPADTNGYSQSPESLAMGSVSDRVFGMANEVAKAVEKAFPGQHKMVGLLAYNAYGDPPSFKMEPNVHIQIASMVLNSKYTQQERYDAWKAVSKNLGVYEYYSVWAWTHDALVAGYINGVHGNQNHIRDDLVRRNIVSMSAESTSSWGPLGRAYYVAEKLMWNPNLDMDALLNDFYSKAFGPAAPMMKKYYETYDPDNGPLMSANLLGHLFRDLNEASEAAANRPDVMERLDQIKLYMRFVDLMWHRDNEGAAVDGKLIMGNLYRTREYALTSWEMIRQNWGGVPAGVEDKPYTHEEIEKDFQEGLARYLPKIRNIGPRVKYSTDLVPVSFPDVKAEQNIKSHQTYQGSTNYALYSLKGEPLEFTTTSGNAWGYQTSYSVTDANGKVLDSGKNLAAKVPLVHKIAVPKAGLYYLNFTDPGAYWTFDNAAGVPGSIVMTPEAPFGRNVEFQNMYIYVPKGIKIIEYFNQGGGHALYGPDGKVQAQVPSSDYAQVPVPEGMDGKLWMLSGISGHILFNNIPAYIAPSPNALLIPREVAEKDGLKIRK
ncbi:MAG: DUF4838 domain-containing protein, partial [Abditibacteriaceae bacterium]